MKKGHAEFWKIMTEEGATEATILLYGFIGEEYTFDTEEQRWEMSGITDLEFVKTLNALAAKYPVINLRINSAGGSTFHGNAIMTAIQNCTAEVHTWNDGICASMAADIWLCAPRRHMAKNAMLMIHSAWDYCIGNSKDMRACADFLDKVNNSVITAVATATGISEDDIRARYYSDYEDHWLTYNEAVADGLVTEQGDYTAGNDPSATLKKMTYKQLLEHFEAESHPEAPGLMKRIQDAFVGLMRARGGQKSIPQPQLHIMNLEELKTSLEDGSLDLAAVKALVSAQEVKDNPQAPAAPVATSAEDIDALKADIAALKAQVAAFASEPGAGKTDPPKPDSDPSKVVINGKDIPDALKAFNDAAAAAAGDNSAMRFTHGN